MRLHSADIENFLSFERATVSYVDQGTKLVIGHNEDSNSADSNGSGKSALAVEPILWGLFGETARGLKGEDVIRRDTEKCRVTIEFSVGPTVYRVTRGQTRKGRGNTLKIEQDGHALQRDKREAQQDLENLLGFDFRFALQAFVLGQESLSFANNTDAEIKKTFERVLGLDVYDTYLARTKERIAQTEHGLREVESGLAAVVNQRTTLQDEISRVTQEILSEQVRVEQQRKQLDITLSDLDRQKIELRVEIEREVMVAQQERDRRISEAKTRLAEARKNVPDQGAAASQELGVRAETITGRLAEIAMLETSVRELQRQHTQLAATADAEGRALAQAEKQAQEVQQSGICPTCKQPLPADTKVLEEQQLKLRGHREIIRDISKKMSSLEGKIEAAALPDETEVQGLRRDLDQVNQELGRIRAAEDQRLQAERLVAQAEHDLQVVQAEKVPDANVQYTKRVQHIDQQIDYVRSQQSKLGEAEISGLQRMLGQAQTKLAATDGEEVKYQQEQRVLREDLDYLRFWEVGWGNKGVRSLVFDTITPYLNERALHYSGILTDGEVDIVFQTQSPLKSGELRDNFKVQTYNRYGAAVYKGASMGEKRRIDTCIALALHDLVEKRTGVHMNFLVLDEIFTNLDPEGVDRVLELLAALGQEKETVFVISNDDSLRLAIPEAIEVRKQGGKSNVVQKLTRTPVKSND